MKKFTKKVREFTEIPEKQVRGSLIAMGTRIIKRSPAKTGRFRNNWQFSIDSPLSGGSRSGDKNGTAAQMELAKSAQKMTLGNKFYMTNNLPYAEKLEYGSSKQAPNGMVRITLAEYQDLLEDGDK